jgi:hypothetical protein
MRSLSICAGIAGQIVAAMVGVPARAAPVGSEVDKWVPLLRAAGVAGE